MAESASADASAGVLPVAFRTLGCKVNRAESEAIAAELLAVGVRIAEEDDAAIVVVNTCTVTGEADAKARKAVRQALAAASRPLVVVTGCLAALDRGALEALGERVVVEADKACIAGIVAGLLGVKGVAADANGESAAAQRSVAASLGRVPAPRGREAGPARAESGAFRTRVALKVEDGCDALCAYCIVPYARGVPRSTSLAQVRAEAEALVEAGTREIVLTGINIGRYADGEARLADVIAAVAATGVSRIRLSSIEPLDLTPELLSVMAETPAFCAHLHVPLQSGSDPVLSAMGRTYTAEQFAERIGAARGALPGLVVTTDVLAGFPGETARQATETLTFCEQTGLGKLHVFRYSRRPGTRAADRVDQIADAEKAVRAAALRDLSSRLARAHAVARRGTTAEVLVERVSTTRNGTPVAEGTTRDYLRVRFGAEAARPGELRFVRLLSVEGERVVGEWLK